MPKIRSLGTPVPNSVRLTCGSPAIITWCKFSLQKHMTTWRWRQSSANPSLSACFPVPREDTGKFAAFGLEMTKAPRLSGGNSIVCEPNFLAAKAGKIFGRTGNPKAHNSERAARLLHVNRRGILIPFGAMNSNPGRMEFSERTGIRPRGFAPSSAVVKSAWLRIQRMRFSEGTGRQTFMRIEPAHGRIETRRAKSSIRT